MGWSSDTTGNIGGIAGLTHGGLVGYGVGKLVGGLFGKKPPPWDPNKGRPAQLDPNTALGTNLPGLDERIAGAGTASPWLGMATTKLNAQTGAAMNQATAQSMQGAATGRAALAMKGGLSGGGAERLARGAANDSLLAKQGVANQALQSGADLGMEDYKQNLANTNLWASMAGNELAEKNKMITSNHAEDMKAWASNNLAAAEMAKAKKKFLGIF